MRLFIVSRMRVIVLAELLVGMLVAVSCVRTMIMGMVMLMLVPVRMLMGMLVLMLGPILVCMIMLVHVLVVMVMLMTVFVVTFHRLSPWFVALNARVSIIAARRPGFNDEARIGPCATG